VIGTTGKRGTKEKSVSRIFQRGFSVGTSQASYRNQGNNEKREWKLNRTYNREGGNQWEGRGGSSGEQRNKPTER